MTTTLVDVAADIDAAVVEHLRVPTCNPVNLHRAMTAADTADRLEIDALLVAPSALHAHPTVLIVPGSAGVAENHIAHTYTLLDEGYTVCLLDPFGARSVVSTFSNQTQFSFAASAVDVVAALAVLGAHPLVDASRINAQGHSRGGSAVLMAAMRPFADAVSAALWSTTDVPHLAGVYAVYPWCGQQFVRPDTGSTQVRAIIGALDDWCSLTAVQAQVQAINLSGGTASLRIVPDAHHSFDRLEDVHELAEARVSPNSPIEYLSDDGSMIDPTTGEADPERSDVDQFRDAVRLGFGRRGAHLGGKGDQPALFRTDMLEFHGRVLQHASP